MSFETLNNYNTPVDFVNKLDQEELAKLNVSFLDIQQVFSPMQVEVLDRHIKLSLVCLYRMIMRDLITGSTLDGTLEQ